jgi:ABC-type glycerol-3-phosphate transport system substrate-binding protein
LVVGSGLGAAAILAGCRSPRNGSTAGSAPSSAASKPRLKNIPGQAAPELKPHPSPDDLKGGPQWTPPDLSGKTLTLWGLNYAPHVERYKMLAQKFKEKTNADVKVEPQNDPQKAMLTAVAGNKTPDVICLMAKLSGQLVKQKALLPLDDVIFKATSIDMGTWWMPDAIGSYVFQGQHLGVPVEGSGTGFSVTGRTDLIESAGKKASSLWPGSTKESEWPAKGVHFESYDQLYALAGELQVSSGSKVTVWGQNRQGWDQQALTSLLYQLDVNWWDEERGTFNLDNDACVEAIKTMVTIPYGKHIETKLAVGNVVNAFVAKQTALGIGNTSCAGEGAKIKIAGENVIAPSLQAGKTPVFMGEGGWGFEIPTQAKNKDVAIEFAKFVTTYDAQFIWSQIYGGFSPACKALVNSPIYQGTSPLKTGQRRVLVALQNTKYWGNGWDPQVGTIIGNVIDLVRTGKSTAPQASKQLQSQLTAQQKEFNGG